MPFHLRLLGVPEIWTRDGDPVDFPVGKPLALLSYLVVEERPVSREELALLLWPESEPDRARHSVRQAIWLLRQRLGEDVIEGDDPVQASEADLSTDVQQFSLAVASGSLDEARQLWRGPFLNRLSLSGCRDWERWREEQRERFGVRLFRGLLDHARNPTETEREERTLRYLEEALLLNPHSMEARVLHVETLLSLGRTSSARLALEEAKRAQTDSNLGGAPLAELEETLREHESRPDSGGQERVGESVEFVGRSHELAELRTLWRGALAGRPRCACVLGPTGVGKTRLAEEFLGVAEASGGRAVRAKGYQSEHRIPRGTVSDLVRQLLSLPGAKGISPGSDAVLRAVLPSLRVKANGQETVIPELPEMGEVHPAALADAVADIVEAVGFEVPLALFIDDWQWVDRESRALLGKVMRRVRGSPCLFLLAERTGERRQRQERAESVIRELGGTHIVLGPLSEAELAELLGLLAVFTDPNRGEELVWRFHRVTGGNPLFVGELLRTLGEEGVYRREGDDWILAVGEVREDLNLPESVQELIGARLERLSPTAAQVAAALAAERRSVPARILRRRAALDDTAFARAVGELVDREVLAWMGVQDLDFAHDQLREAAGHFFRTDGRRRIRRWVQERPGWSAGALLGAAATVFLVLPGVSRTILGEAEATYPFGKGNVLLVGSRSALGFSAPSREGEDWIFWSSSLPLPHPHHRFRVADAFRTPDGGLRWFGDASPAGSGTYALELIEEGGERVIFQTEGDDAFRDVSPCGAQALVTSENPETEVYDYDLFVVDADAGTSRRIYRAQERIRFARWSPDGQRIAAGLRAGVDTLAMLSPKGDVLGRMAFPEYRHVHAASWCADSRTLLLQVEGDEGRRGLVLDTREGTYGELPGEFAVRGGPVCLGTDRAAMGVVAGETGMSLRLFDLLSGESVPIPAPAMTEPVVLLWVSDELMAPIEKIRITESIEVLSWGTKDTLETKGVRTDGSREDVESAWASSDPSVLSVQPGGVLSANKAGTAWIIATYREWLRDSLEIRVEDSGFANEALLFRASFADPDLPEWEAYGDPVASVAQNGEDWVLSLNGDGRYPDGVYSRSSFSLAQGATLEFEFRLRLGRTDRQRLSLCLWEDGQEARGPSGTPLMGLDRFCLQYPSDEQLKFREDLASVVSGPSAGRREFSVAPFRPSDDWVHLALQVRADGATSVFLDRRLASRPAGRLDLAPGQKWRINLYGASVGTDLWIRNLTLWRGERFDADVGPVPSPELPGVITPLAPGVRSDSRLP
jgi:DNA-binding SARP family transcriptional activator